MKKLLIIPLVFAVCLSCTESGNISEKQKQKIISEVKQVNDSANMLASRGDMKKLMEDYDWNTPEFILAVNGKTFKYDDFYTREPIIEKQEPQIVDEKFTVLGRNLVLYTGHQTWMMHMKDGSEILQDPYLIQTIYKKSDGKWKAISVSETAENHLMKRANTHAGPDQVKGMNKFLGKWACTWNDTTLYIDQKPFSDISQEVSFKMVTKGKTISEGKQLVFYDRGRNTILVSNISKQGGNGNWTAAMNFKDDSKYEFVWNEDNFHPESAVMKGQGEFTSPDEYVETLLFKDKPVSTFTYKRIK